jgi:hypothetical protein
MESRYRRYARITLVMIALLSGGFGLLITQRLQLDYDFENFFPQDDPETRYFKEFREQFGTDNDFVLVGVESENGIFRKDFLAEVNRLADSLAAMQNVVQVISPTNLELVLVSGSDGMPHRYRLLTWDNPEFYAQDSAAIYSDPRFAGTYFSTDAQSVAIMVVTKPFLNKKECDQLVVDLNALMPKFSFKETRLAGRAIGQSYYINLMQTDFIFFFSSSAVLLVIFLFIAFRSAWGIWVPLTVVMLSTLWTLGVMVAVGGKVNLILTMLPTIMFVVGISDVVHIVSRYLEELRAGKSKIAALRDAYREVGMATFLTSLTTAIGFFTLLTLSVGPIRDFGLYTGIGVFIAYLLAFTLLPAVLVLRKPPATGATRQHHTIWYKVLHWSARGVFRRPGAIVVVGMAFMGACGWLVTQIGVNNYLLEDLRDDNPMKQDFVFFEEHFAGVRPFEMGVEVRDTSMRLTDTAVQRELERVEDWLSRNYGVGNIVSPNTPVKSLNMAINGAETKFYTLPQGRDVKRVDRMMDRMAKMDTANLSAAFISVDYKTGRVQGKVADLGSRYFLARNDDFNAFLNDSLGSGRLLDYHITGTAHLVDKNNSYLASSLVIGLLIAFGVISLLAGIFYQSWRMIPIALLPNILPLLLIGAIMHLVGQELKVSTSIIFTIAFGIAVDDTIHFLSKLRIELMKGRGLMLAVRRTYLSSGRAIILTTLILCSGFLTLMFSVFEGTYLIGLLISLTLFFAVIADLTLLPALIILFYKPRGRKKNQ